MGLKNNEFSLGGNSLAYLLFPGGTVKHHLLDDACILAKSRTFAPLGFHSIMA